MSTQVITPQTLYADLPEWLTVRESAAYLNVSLDVIYQAVRRWDAGDHVTGIPHRRFGPKLIHIPKKFFSDECVRALEPQAKPAA